MTLAGDTQNALDLATLYVEGATQGGEHATLQAFFDAIAGLIQTYDIRSVMALVSESHTEDPVKTFVERSLLDCLARSPRPSLKAMQVLFSCQDYESLISLSKNADVDEMNRSRARREAQRIKQAYMSQFD